MSKLFSQLGTKNKTVIKLFTLLVFALFSITSYSQCDVNNPYDRIFSGYHASIAIKTNGIYSVWGASMKSTGNTDQLVPQDLNATNYPGLTGTIIKSAIGGSTSGASVDQAILLTTTGLWAWGVEDAVIDNSLTSSSAFARITSPAGAQSTGLPTGVAPSDVKAMFATFRTLVLLTNSGNVWILTQTTLAIEGNGGTASTVGSNTWKQVKTDAVNYLSDVKYVRGQVSSTTYNAFVAETNSGQIYTWGNSTFLGNGTAATARNYATLMTLPSNVTTNGIKMIGVTGGDGGSTVANTYFVVSNTGNLYSLGDNAERQCGDFTTTNRTSWVQVQKSATPGDYLTNVNYISVQEHNSSYPAATAVTSIGDLYTWGNNSKNMLGRPVDGTMYDPGFPGGFTSGTDKALFSEVGGHTLVYAKVGSSQICYVGHRIQGSMGDGTSADATETTFNCTTTPVLDLCGSVPVSASTTTSIISANPTNIVANGTATSTITIQLKQPNGTNLTSTGGIVVINTDKGAISTVTDNNNGTYTAILTSSTNIESATLTYTLNGATGTNTATVNFTAAPNPVISTSGSLKTFSTCSGCTVAPQTFTVSGVDLSTNNIVVAAPTGFEVSTISNSGFATTINLTPTAGTVTTTTVYTKLINTASSAASGVISITSTGATAKTITITTNTDNSLNFDGVDDNVTIADNNALDVTTNYTIEAWIKPTTFTQLGGIVSKYHTAAANGYILRLTATGDFSGISFDEMNTSNGVLTLNKWNHVAAVKNGVTRKLYVNGVEQTLTGTALTTVVNTDPVIIGQDFSSNGSRFFNGSIDEVRIWNTARSATEITNNINVSMLGNEAGLVANYNFDQGIANGTNTATTTLTDITANSLSGTISGVTLTGNTSNFVEGFMPSISAAGNATTLASSSTLTLTNGLNGGVWSSTNAGIATVNANTGLVTGVAGGNVTITYTICNKSVAYNLTVIQAATLTSSSLKTFTSCSGCVITPQSIIVSGANLTAGVTISAPAGFEIATATNGTYTSTISLTPNAGTLTNTNIYVRLINSATAATSGNLTITSTGATSKTITATVNTDNALNLDGTNDKVTIADNNALDLTTNYTIETWIKPTAFNASAGIVSKYHSASSNGYILRLTGTGDFSGVSFDEMNTSNGILSLNKWYHIAAVNNNGTRKLYINGVEQTLTGTPITTAANTDPLIIGQDYLLAGSRFFKGSIDEVRIWNTARTATEITNNMNVALGGNEAGLVANYNFDQGIANGTNTSITTLNDYTANALDGTISGFTLTGNSSNFVDGFMPSITAAGNATEFLLGNTLTLSNILTGGTWSSTNTNIATVNTTTGIVTGVSTGTATITYTICGKTASYTVNVTTITATGTLTNFSSCFGIASAAQSIVVSAVTLTNDLVITAPAGYEVATTAGGTYSTSISLTPISGTVTNTTIFIRLSANGFNGDHGNLVLSSGSATPKLVPIGLASVKLNVAARVTISSDAVGNKICTGTNVNFTASAINGGLTPTYQWKLNGANVGINSSTYSNTNLSNNDVVTVIMTSGITSCVTGTPATSNSITIAVYSVPATPTAISGINALCLGSNATYTISDVTFATSYDWVVSGNITATTSSSTAINTLANSATGSATVKVRAVNFCGTSAYTNDYNLTISNTFAPKADFTMSNNEICLGVSANNFTNTSTVNSTTNSPLTKYTWNFGDGSALVNTLNASRNYTAAGKYNVVLEIQSQDNCLSSISKQVIVYPVSVAGTAKALDSVICEGTSTTINLFGATGSIQWMSSPAGANTWTNIPGATSDVLNTGNLTASTDYKAEVRSGVCTVATSNTVSITVKYAPSVSILPPSGVGITDTTFKLAYIINSGNPNAYTVDVFGSNPMPNFIPNINYALRGSPLTIAIPPSAMGNYVFSFVATELPYACYSSGPPLTFTLGVGQGNGGGSSIGLSYTTPNVYTVGNTITALNPTITGGALSAYAISPLLPAGLTIDANTGIISGTPSKIFSTTTFVVTGTNTSSTATATVVITVNAAPPAPPVVQSAKYVFGKPGIPTSLNTFVNPLPTGVVPVWCVVGTQNCATAAPAMPSAIGKYIYQVRSFDTATRLYSTTFVNDTLIIAPPPPIVVDSTYVLGVATNPSNIGVQVSGLSGATFNYFYLTAKQTGIPALGSTIGTKRYTVSQIVNSVESDTASFNVTLLDPNSIIHLQKIVDTGVMQSNSTYNFQFKLIVTNLTNTAFSNVVLIDNLQNSVPNTSAYSVISNTATGGLKANSSFNGNSDINVTLAASTIAPLAKDTSKFVINLVPNGYSGVLTNIAYVKATTKWGTINMQSSELSISNPASKLPTKYQVRDLVLNIPEGFSPNNDGVHDYFVIIKPLNTTIDLEVFNRWGNVVFSSNNYNNDWNGKGTGNFAGQDLVDGGYYYTLRAVDDKGKAQVFKGFVIIQR